MKTSGVKRKDQGVRACVCACVLIYWFFCYFKLNLFNQYSQKNKTTSALNKSWLWTWTSHVYITINLFNLCQHFFLPFYTYFSKCWHMLNEPDFWRHIYRDLFLCSVSSVKMRGDCLFCWYWLNRWPSLFKFSFHS